MIKVLIRILIMIRYNSNNNDNNNQNHNKVLSVVTQWLKHQASIQIGAPRPTRVGVPPTNPKPQTIGVPRPYRVGGAVRIAMVRVGVEFLRVCGPAPWGTCRNGQVPEGWLLPRTSTPLGRLPNRAGPRNRGPLISRGGQGPSWHKPQTLPRRGSPTSQGWG